MIRNCFALLFALVVAVPSPAQAVSATIFPSPALPGQTLQFIVTAIQPIQLPSSCAYANIRAISPSGPPMPLGIFCLTVITPLVAGQSLSQSISTAGFAPGTYWVEVRYFGVGAGITSEFFCFELRSPITAGPILAAQTVAQQGTNLLMSLSDPPSAGQLYIAAASFTTNTGIPVPGFISPLCLDPDALFNLSYPAALPGLFSNFSGALDASGLATGIGISIPVAPVLTNRGLHVQAVTFGGIGPRISNGLSFTISP
ncbi:MAG TPA: hypothetical protein PKA37_11275 [Planctomycetota bacterium]|jgi:hypothetical protein|nr:hypothetical protein [Planctomycetota bacterium]